MHAAAHIIAPPLFTTLYVQTIVLILTKSISCDLAIFNCYQEVQIQHVFPFMHDKLHSIVVNYKFGNSNNG